MSKSSFHIRQARRFATSRARNWGLIGFQDLARSMAERQVGLFASNEAVDAAYQLLWDDFERGLFSENGRSMVLFVNPHMRPKRLSRALVGAALSSGVADHRRVHTRNLLFRFCWTLPDLADRFFAFHEMPLPGFFSSHLERRESILALHRRLRSRRPRMKRQKRGPTPVVFDRLVAEMRRDFPVAVDLDRLGKMKQEELASRYKASRSYCVEARKYVLAEFRKAQLRQTPTGKK